MRAFSIPLLKGTLVVGGLAAFWGIDGTNHLWPEFRPYTVYVAFAFVFGSFWLFTRTTD